MIVLKCKMCGGDLEVQDSATTFTCKFCGSTNMLTGPAAEQKPTTTEPDISGLLRNGHVYLAEGNYERARQCFEGVLHNRADNADGSLGLFLCDIGCTTLGKMEQTAEVFYHSADNQDLNKLYTKLSGNPNLAKAEKYANGELAARLSSLHADMDNLLYTKLEQQYITLQKSAADEEENTNPYLPKELYSLANLYEKLGTHSDAPEKAKECATQAKALQDANEAREEKGYKYVYIAIGVLIVLVAFVVQATSR